MVSTIPELSTTTEALPATSDDLARRYYRPREVAKVTGVASATVFAALYAAELEGYRFGRAWLIPVDAVDTWIRGRTEERSPRRRGPNPRDAGFFGVHQDNATNHPPS